MITRLRLFSCLALLTLILSACGGGGGGGGSTTIPTKVLIKISTSGISPSTQISAANGTLILPNGITPSATDPGDTLGTFDASRSIIGYNSTTDSLRLIASYVSSTRSLTFNRLELSGFASGEIMTISCNIDPLITITASDIPATATIVELLDSSTNNILGATMPISLTFQ